MAGEHYLGEDDLRTVWWQSLANAEAVCMIDQSRLPGEVVTLTLTTEQQVAEAIVTLKVRGAPAIGVTAAFGLALGAFRLWREQGNALPPGAVAERLRFAGEMLRATRPTAVNLSWAIERMLRRADHALLDQVSSAELAQFMLAGGSGHRR